MIEEPNEQGLGYFVDPEKAEEAERLRTQGRFLDKIMGLLPTAVLPALTASKDFQVLDVGCSSGGWTSDVAARYRRHVHVTGIDISENMLRSARARAVADRIQKETTYQIMDATKRLLFADASFHLIHARLLFAFQTRETWPLFMKECARILRPGGYLLLTENDAQCWTTSPALAEFYRLGHLAIYKNRNSFQQEYVGIVARFPNMLRSIGFDMLSMDTYRIDIGREFPEGYRIAAKDHLSLYRDLQPYYVSLGVATQDELNNLYQQMVEEIEAPDFNAYWFFTRIVGRKPEL